MRSEVSLAREPNLMIWERSQAPPENKDSYIHWSVGARRAGRARLPLANPRACDAINVRLSLRRHCCCCTDGCRHWCCGGSRTRARALLRWVAALLSVGAPPVKERIHFILRARTIVTLYVIINIIVIIVKRESSSLHIARQSFKDIYRIFIVILILV